MLPQREELKYLGHLHSEGKMEREIDRWMGAASGGWVQHQVDGFSIRWMGAASTVMTALVKKELSLKVEKELSLKVKLSV